MAFIRSFEKNLSFHGFARASVLNCSVFMYEKLHSTLHIGLFWLLSHTCICADFFVARCNKICLTLSNYKNLKT